MTIHHLPILRRAAPVRGLDPTFVQGLGGAPTLGQALPPPANPAMSTRFADAFQFDENVAARKPTAESKLTDALMRMVRTTTITAAPPAHIRPTPFSDALDLSATIVVPNVPGPYTKVITYTVPKGRGGRIEQYGVTVQDPAYTWNGSLLWAFTVNGAFLGNGLSNWGEQRGSSVFPRKTVIFLNFGDIVSFLVRRAVVGTMAETVQMSMRGWTWRTRNTFVYTQASSPTY